MADDVKVLLSCCLVSPNSTIGVPSSVRERKGGSLLAVLGDKGQEPQDTTTEPMPEGPGLGSPSAIVQHNYSFYSYNKLFQKYNNNSFINNSSFTPAQQLVSKDTTVILPDSQAGGILEY